MIRSVLNTGLDVIGMVKQLKQRYTYKGKKYTLHELKRMVRFEGAEKRLYLEISTGKVE